VPRRRWLIASLLGFGVFVNYLDRVNISVSQQALHQAFGISTIAFGYLLSAYSWTYAALQLPSGVLLDRWGVRKVGLISTALWSIASFCAAAASGLASFFVARLLLGIGEAPTFPGNSKAVGYWFPDDERSLATAFFDSAAKLGPAIGVPIVGLLLLHFGWRWSFAATAITSVLYLAMFYWLYKNPSEDQKLSAAEREYIAAGGAQPEEKNQTAASRAAQGPATERQIRSSQAGHRASLGYLLRQRKVAGLVLGSAAYNYTFYLLLTWLPSYLATSLQVNLHDSVLYTSVPWIFAACTDFFIGGWLVNKLIQWGHDASRVRQFVLVAGTAFGLGILGAARAHTAAAAIFWISISIGGLAAAAPVGWSIPSLIAPPGSVGRLGGILNFGNQLSAIVAPIVTGYIASATHSFAWAFAAATAFLLIGILGYVVLLGRIEPIPDPV
jgi:ACS family D-galactonate transporter-like MFS transporter